IPSYLVADGSELDPAWLANAKIIGLSAGASAPEAMVEHVIDSLRQFGPVEVSQLDGIEENIEFRLPTELQQRD
ncbi:4-hydroxy-3-methylbut-2-enyl diphosphate reductase, partial [Klebsiella pneumoniae]